MRALLLALALLGCNAEREPVEPVWNKQPCDHCRMLLSERPYAAQAIDPEGDRRFFDDVGCLADYLNDHPGSYAAWVALDDGWVDVAQARFVGDRRTPMGSGFAASADGGLDFTAVRASR